MPKYRVMCHPQPNGKPPFYTIEVSRWGWLWNPMVHSATETLAKWSTQWEAMDYARRLAAGKEEPHVVAYFP